ncbi:sufurtransferase FdhD [Pseudoflavonifractor sp. 524-17]|uniref:formate dehydrogenase accessory sulfurtransferase FdhD n=1 Tax=Pseudoflavonifractor sp. 524-17 TaxID=2304577 RepID=UPI00137972A7|nr:formate dehydrogenase accessory sulfurtransferase FdhD [Pseudoflavonifractor sp. 524-17]NCE65340.1 sufurtransferase FdhD [Pseudoflavonifractor sp. 524-17]
MSEFLLSQWLPVTRAEGDAAVPGQDEVVVEHTLQVEVNGVPSFSLSCSPEYLEELVAGNLYSRGLISASEQICALSPAPDWSRVSVSLSPACPQTPQEEPPLTLPASTAYWLMSQNLTASALFQRTGGVHCVSLYWPDHPLLSRQDLARHNAVDKVIGHALLHALPLSQAVLAVSGRLSADMMDKAARARIPIVLSKGAPTSRAIQIAQTHHITLTGFIRGERMNLYTWPERIRTVQHS